MSRVDKICWLLWVLGLLCLRKQASLPSLETAFLGLAALGFAAIFAAFVKTERYRGSCSL